jgi:predicted RNase H-like HicB family nuclease
LGRPKHPDHPPHPKALNQRTMKKLLEANGWVATVGGKHVAKMEKRGHRPITLPANQRPAIRPVFAQPSSSRQDSLARRSHDADGVSARHPCRRSRNAAPIAKPTTLHLTAVVTREGDWYVARCLEIEATSQGETVEQALDNLRDVVEVYLEEEPAPAAPRPPLLT